MHSFGGKGVRIRLDRPLVKLPAAIIVALVRNGVCGVVTREHGPWG